MRIRRVLLGSVIVAMAAFSGAALARGYAGASAGQSDFKLDCDPGATCDTKDTGFKLFGGYMFTPNFGIEVAYFDMGKATERGSIAMAPPVEGPVRTASVVRPSQVIIILPPGIGGGTDFSAELKATGFGVWALANAPVGNAGFFAKVGLASVKSEATVSASGFGSASESKTHTDLAWGVGASYDFTKNFGARVEWERFRAKFPDGNGGTKYDIDFVSAGVVYRF